MFLLKRSEMIIMEIFNTKDEFFVGENYFTTFKYETLESNNDIIRSNIVLSLIQYQKSRWSKMRRNQHCALTSEKLCSNVCHEVCIYLDRLVIQGVKRGLVSKERLVWKEDGQVIEFIFPYSSLNLYSILFLHYNTALNEVKFKLWK